MTSAANAGSDKPILARGAKLPPGIAAAQSLATLRTAPTAWMHRSAEDRAAPAENVSKLPAESEQADAAESNVAPAWRTAEFRVSASGQRVWLIRLRQQPRGFLLDSPIR